MKAPLTLMTANLGMAHAVLEARSVKAALAEEPIDAAAFLEE